MNKVRVIITDRQKSVKVPTGIRMILRRCCNAVLKSEGVSGDCEVNILFTDDEGIQALNNEFRGKDAVTDVLSFPLSDGRDFDINPETGAKMLGDIVINVGRAVEQAKDFNHSFQREMGYLTTHSMLHILGYDHVAGGIDAATMREKEEIIMNMVGQPRVPAEEDGI